MLSQNFQFIFLFTKCFIWISSIIVFIEAKPFSQDKEQFNHNNISLKLQFVLLEDLHEDLETQKTNLRISWTWCGHFPDSFGIWEGDPAKNIENPKLKLLPGNCTGSVEFEFNVLSNLPRKLDNQSCLNFWAGIVKQGSVVESSCLEIFPFWMSNKSRFLHKKKINEIIVPGLSNQNSYSVINGQISSWYHLLLGYRYFDIEVKDESIDGKYRFIINNNNVTTELKVYLKELTEYLNKTKEIIFIELTFNPYSLLLENNAFYRIQELIYYDFESIVLPSKRAADISMEYLWKSNKRLILFLNIPFDINIPMLWNTPTSIDYMSLSTRYPDHIIYLSNKFKRRRIPFKLIYEEESEKEENKFISFMRTKLIGGLNFVILSNTSIDILKYLMTDAVTPSHESENIQRTGRTEISSQKTSLCKEIKENRKSNVSVWITLKAKEIKNKYRLIELHWKTDNISDDYTVALFDKDPKMENISLSVNNFSSKFFNVTDSNHAEHPKINNRIEKRKLKPLVLYKINSTEGKITTNISFERTKIDVLKTGHCLGYYVAIFSKNDLLESRCIKAYPQWMWDSREVLVMKELRKVVIPGSHNAGIYSTKDSNNFIENYLLCQDEDIITQLLFGIRYLDLRIGYYPGTKELLWINHDKIRWIPLRNVLEDVRLFTTISKDPVMIHVHRTPVGFDHMEANLFLAKEFEDVLGENAIPHSIGQSITFKDIWRLNKTVIISYGNYHLREDYPFLWTPINQAWADTTDIDKLKSFIDNEMKYSQYMTYFWAAMCQLTATVWDVFTNPLGVRGFADETNELITKWLRNEWKHNSNIMAMDFFHSSDIIYTSIQLNCMNKSGNREGQNLHISFDGASTSEVSFDV